jgi:hypothetical protein
MPWQVTGITGEVQETAQEIKYPYTFGPIVTSIAIPVAKGKFSLQPYWYLYCTNSKFSPNWRRINADGNYASLSGLTPKTFHYLRNEVLINLIPGFDTYFKEPGIGKFTYAFALW